jgi:hypothetical protein
MRRSTSLCRPIATSTTPREINRWTLKAAAKLAATAPIRIRTFGRWCEMRQRAFADLRHTECMFTKQDPASLSSPQPGDVLVSHASAVREHDISIVPNAPHAMSPTHDEAVVDARSEADTRGVDAWVTEDKTHVVKIAAHRTPAE